MKRAVWWLLSWLVLSLVLHTITAKPCDCPPPQCKIASRQLYFTKGCMKGVSKILDGCPTSSATCALKLLEQILEETENEEVQSLSLSEGGLQALLYKPKDQFNGIKIHASDSEVKLNEPVSNSKVRVQLPRELDPGQNNNIVFCRVTWPETSEMLSSFSDNMTLYERTWISVSVHGKTISGLQEPVNITMTLSQGISETQKPTCVFYNFTANNYSDYGCQTIWERNQSNITCSCNHLTYFGVLLINQAFRGNDQQSPPVSAKDQKILTYISLIGCSLSLLGLVVTVVLFSTNRKTRSDVSMKVHISLAIALILLNTHFILSQIVTAVSVPGLCLYLALSLHYSLLATFSWMAVEGFHLYLLLVRVFNIYIRRYLLKLSVVGWGIPAIIVSLVVIIDKTAYGQVNLANSNSTAMCYIVNGTVQMVTTVGVFALVFVFNVIMLAVAVKGLVGASHRDKFGHTDRNRAKRNIFTMLGITTLLGVTWGLIFFSFGPQTTTVLYIFCILNSLQGFFIFVWFVMSLRKIGNSNATTSNETRSASS